MGAMAERWAPWRRLCVAMPAAGVRSHHLRGGFGLAVFSLRMAVGPRLLFHDAERGEKPLQAGRAFAVVLGIFLATRLLVWTFAYAGSLLDFRIAHRLDSPIEKHAEQLRPLLLDAGTVEGRDFRRLMLDFGPLCRFDGDHYRSIVERGYSYKPVSPETPQKEKEQNIAFFPLFPLLAQPFAMLFGSARAGMVVVSNGCALAAAWLLFRWIAWRIDTAVATFAVAAVLCLPQACYYSFGYAESCTLLFTVATLYLLDRQRFGWAALMCGLATATRPTAAALVPVFAIAYWWTARGPVGTRGQGTAHRAVAPMLHGTAHRARAPMLALAPLALSGIGAYALYLTLRFGSPLVYFDNFRAGWVPDHHRADWFQFLTLARVWDQFKHFGRALSGLPASLPELLNPFAWNMAINLFVLFLSLAGWRRAPSSFRPFLLLGPLIFLQAYVASGGATFGVQPISRYMAVSVGAFVVLAAWCVREWPAGLRYGLLTFFVVLQAAWALRFGMGEWSS